MLMTDGEITSALAAGKMAIEPFDKDSLEPCSYDAHLGKQALVSRDYRLIDTAKENSVRLAAGDFALIMTEESFRLPLNMAGHIGMKSELARRGLVLLAGMQIDPGFEGHLRLGLYNASGRPITIDHLDPICSIEFHALSKEATRGVGIFPELKDGRIPEADKAFLRELESTSLSEMAQNLRTLSDHVRTLTTITYKFILPLIVAILAGVVVTVLRR